MLSYYPAEDKSGPLLIHNIDTSVKVGDFDIIAYDEALAGLNSVLDYEVTPENIIAFEILYSTRPVHGFYVPCYVFYADMGETCSNKDGDGLRHYVTFYYPALEGNDLYEILIQNSAEQTESVMLVRLPEYNISIFSNNNDGGVL
jgi:hypothetical protein